jgi:branched-chain amino acid transport system permease protein
MDEDICRHGVSRLLFSGGIGTIESPIIGVLVFYPSQTNVAHFGAWYLILLGLLAIVVMLFALKGIGGSLLAAIRPR